MKITAKILCVLISAAMLCGCSEGVAEETTAAETEVTSLSEVTMAETVVIPTEAAVLETDEPETTVTEAETTLPETEAYSEQESSSAETYFDMNIPDYETLLAEFEKSTITYGNSTCGYIQSDQNWIYEDVSSEEYCVTSPDGISTISVFAMSDMGMNTVQYAYMSAVTMALNAEIDGYEHYNISEMTIDNMDGFYVVMNDLDTDLGFMLYLTLADEENGIIYNLIGASTDDSTLNVLYLSMMFDTFRR